MELLRAGLAPFGRTSPNVLSIDRYGNDLYLVEEMLRAGIAPELFIAECNGKVPPPIRWVGEYDSTFVWRSADYFGASLAACDVFTANGYNLVCCNLATGLNAFYAREMDPGYPISTRTIARLAGLVPEVVRHT